MSLAVRPFRPMSARELVRATALAAAAAAACDDGIGDPGTEIPETMASLTGGVLFSTWVLEGADGYDIFWSPIRGSTPGNVQGFLPLTTAGGNETQPAVAANGQAFVFVREDQGIMRVGPDGRITRVSDIRDTDWVDSLPAISPDANRVAWVREDRSRAIGSSGFFATEVWVANADGSEARAVDPKPDVIQDAPAFDPIQPHERLAWSEFNAATLGGNGPVDYGVWLYDLGTLGGRFVCRGAVSLANGQTVRCFGQHLAWPDRNRLVLSQQLLEMDPESGRMNSRLPALLNGLASGTGGPWLDPSPSGFFPAFPLSASYLGNSIMIDGLYAPLDGDQLTLAFFVAGTDGSNPVRFQVAGHQGDLDPGRTGGYLFSLSTPQLVP